MRICLDLDGVVCALRRPNEEYKDLQPIPGAAERIRELRKAGHFIILMTARHMKTCEGNVGRVIAKQGKVTLDWLEKHGIEYDELHFGKPHADIYIDDNALRFESWDQIAGDGKNLPRSHEQVAGLRPEAEP